MFVIFKFPPLIFITCFIATQVIAAQPKLEKYNVDANAITVSGISSGGCMAIQVHYALSNIIKGSGLFEGGPFACYYKSSIIEAMNCVGHPEKVNVQKLIEKTDRLASEGQIDPTSNLNSSKIYIFHGLNDETVPQKSSINAEEQCRHYGADLFTKFDSESNHGQPVDGNGYGGPCDKINSNYINECGYNGAFEMLNWLYGTPEQNLTRPEKGFVADGKIVHFDQNEFVKYPAIKIVSWMADSAFLYIPKNCSDGTIQCKLHVSFHGCASNEQHFGTKYATETQYAEVAEVNNIIILFPQTANVPIVNPKGCWDCVGLTGPLSSTTKSGLEISAVQRMIQRITSG